MFSVEPAAPPELFIPVSAPEFAKAYRIQPRAAVPSKLLLRVIVPVAAPVLVSPVTACTVEEVAQPRSVLVLRLGLAPVDELRAPTKVAVAPVVEVSPVTACTVE